MASLRDLGLSEYEARAYRSLLRVGPTTAKELSRTSEVPMGRVYDVLNALERYGLARSQAASRPKKYVGVEPDAALDKLLADKKRELEERAEQYEDIVDDLSEELDAARPVGGQFWTAAVGPEETLDLLVERVAAADEEIVMIAGAPSAGFDLGTVGERVVEALEEALARGVEISLLMSPELVRGLPESVGDRYRDRLQEQPGFDVRTVEDVDGTFELIDDAEVCIEVQNPLNPGEAFAMIDLKDPEFVSGVRSEFDPRWERAAPLEL